MPGVNLERLAGAHQKEKAGKSKYRLHAARLRKEGRGIREISRMLGVPYSTVRDWPVRMHAGNLSRRFDRERGGRAGILSRKILRKIKAVAEPRPVPLRVRGRILADGHDPGHAV